MEPDFSKAPPPRAESYFTASDAETARSQELLAEGVVRHQAGDLARARHIYRQVLALNARHFDALHLLGALVLQAGDAAQALDLFDAAVALNADHAETFINRGIALRDLKRHAAALESYDAAIALKPDQAAAHNNRGVTLGELGRHDEALAAYDRAVALQPNFVEGHNNRGLALRTLGRLPAALAANNDAIRLDPGRAESHSHRGHVLAQMNQPEAALAAYTRALKLDPELPYLYGTRLHLKMLVCDWTDFYTAIADLCARIPRGERVIASHSLLALIDSPLLHRQAAAIWANDKHPPNKALGAVPNHAPRAKIRVGYFSMDFRVHPVSSLTVGLIEAHDRDAFEIFGFSFGVDTKDEMRQRLEAAFDHFIDLRAKSDIEIAALARELQLDIAVDLAGYTEDARTAIFALRAAPVQVSYLGYLGTMAADYIDYIVADATVIPQTSFGHYSEKVVALPSYQVNDTSRRIADGVFTRADWGLPNVGFVFCCFNNTYKITPATFDGWMRILKAVEGSVLFLYANSPSAISNLRRGAVARGVDPGRLVFGKRVPMAEYLARLQAADLFLDTLPYNAGTTASDALWVGLPVLTRSGESLAARVAASLLRAIGLPELITTTQAEYETLATALARDPARHAGIRARLAHNRLTTPLFDVRRFAAYIEDAYRQMCARQRAGLPPDHIVVKPIVEEPEN